MVAKALDATPHLPLSCQPLAEIPVFNYVMSIRDREFIVRLTQDMMSQWGDHRGRTLDDQLQGELEDSTRRVLITDEIFAKALEMLEKERLEESKLGTSPNLNKFRLDHLRFNLS